MTTKTRAIIAGTFAGLSLLTTAAQADTIFSETFSGSNATNLVGTITTDGNNWAGDPSGFAKQDGSQTDSWTAYHAVTIAPGNIYTLEADVTTTNTGDNGLFSIAFATGDGAGTSGAVWSEGSIIYGSSGRSGSGFMYGFAGPGSGTPLGSTLTGQPQGNLIVVLDATDPLNYTVQIFDGSGNANGAPVGIGPAALTHIAISGGTNGTFNSLTLTAEAAAGNKFIDWIGAYPNVGAEAALTDDPDRDGIDSGVENFFGTDPSVASQGLVSGTVSGNNFTFTHPQGTLADNLTAAYRWSKDLQTFYGNLSTDGDGTTVEFTVQLDTPSLGTTTVTATVTGTATDRLFVNVRVIKDDEHAEVVVMLGDSTTEQGLPTEVKLQLDALITDPLLQTTVINSGKGGDNATAALARLQTDVLDHNPDIVTVSFGLNDTALRDPEQFEQSMSQIITTLQNAGIQVVLLTSTPFDNARHSWGPDFVADGGLDEYMDSNLLERTRSLAAANTLPLGDLHTIFTDAFQLDSNLINVVISSDGVHLTQAGKVMAAENIAPALYPLLIAN